MPSFAEFNTDQTIELILSINIGDETKMPYDLRRFLKVHFRVLKSTRSIPKRKKILFPVHHSTSHFLYIIYCHLALTILTKNRQSVNLKNTPNISDIF